MGLDEVDDGRRDGEGGVLQDGCHEVLDTRYGHKGCTRSDDQGHVRMYRAKEHEMTYQTYENALDTHARVAGTTRCIALRTA